MFLDLNVTSPPLKLVYQLSIAQYNGQEDVKGTQEATLDKTSPWGLKGTYGLFCSNEWWDNIKNGVMPTKYVSGIITRTYAAGMDTIAVVGDFELLLADGSKWNESCYANDENYSYFQVGCRVDIFYAFDPLKKLNKKGEVQYLKMVLEMAVSSQPVSMKS